MLIGYQATNFKSELVRKIENGTEMRWGVVGRGFRNAPETPKIMFFFGFTLDITRKSVFGTVISVTVE